MFHIFHIFTLSAFALLWLRLAILQSNAVRADDITARERAHVLAVVPAKTEEPRS